MISLANAGGTRTLHSITLRASWVICHCHLYIHLLFRYFLGNWQAADGQIYCRIKVFPTKILPQFRAIGTNYNQVVKELRFHFSEKKAMALLYKLEKHTIDLVKLSREIVELSREMYAKWEQQN